jgi:hypothetical protein
VGSTLGNRQCLVCLVALVGQKSSSHVTGRGSDLHFAPCFGWYGGFMSLIQVPIGLHAHFEKVCHSARQGIPVGHNTWSSSHVHRTCGARSHNALDCRTKVLRLHSSMWMPFIKHDLPCPHTAYVLLDCLVREQCFSSLWCLVWPTSSLRYYNQIVHLGC